MPPAKTRCNTCNRLKGNHLFYAKELAKKRGSMCKSCYKKTPAYRNQLSRQYQRTYGITLEEYDAILEGQKGTCYICHRKPYRRRLAVDHDHALEKHGMRYSVRGLLCRTCNEYLGQINDSVAAARRMHEYLARGNAIGHELEYNDGHE